MHDCVNIQVIHAKKGDLSSVEQFLEMGANVDATDPIKVRNHACLFAPNPLTLEHPNDSRISGHH